MGTKEQIINKIIAAVSKTTPESEIYLYGSRAREDNNDLSDWDLLILLNSDKIPFQLETSLFDSLFEVELETGEVIAPIIYSKKEWDKKYIITPLHENIAKEGVRIK